jgi:hypothetical protein
MIEKLILLAIEIAGAGLAPERAQAAAEVAAYMAEHRDPKLYFPKLAAVDEAAARYKVARIYLTWPFYESSWHAKVVGDNGRSCGYMQVGAIHFPWTRMSCEEMQISAYWGATAGARALEHLIETCGSLESGLGAFATGRCGGAAKLVRARCDKGGAGGCKDEVPSSAK